MPVIAVSRFEHFFRAAAGLDVDKADLKRHSDFVNRKLYDMLVVADNLRRALDAVPAEALEKDAGLKSLAEGVELTARDMLAALERHGVRKLEPKGNRFDPNFHQAMFEVENPDLPAGTVVEVVQEGYVIGERVLRPALVGVSRGGARAAETAASGK